ncbi:hypothetical protein EV361DRAFT_1036618 [Lentinula raphanica]|nr:hypothetical protein EV361DRAFT_1036618 [Lentinula raphanica]
MFSHGSDSGYGSSVFLARYLRNGSRSYLSGTREDLYLRNSSISLAKCGNVTLPENRQLWKCLGNALKMPYFRQIVCDLKIHQFKYLEQHYYGLENPYTQTLEEPDGESKASANDRQTTGSYTASVTQCHLNAAQWQACHFGTGAEREQFQ